MSIHGKKFLAWGILGAIIGVTALGVIWKTAHQDETHRSHVSTGKYRCPMHPQVVSDKPGDCPICHMRLVPFETEANPKKSERKIVFYRNPMNPEIKSMVPAKDEMGMDYIPVYSDEVPVSGSVQGRVDVLIDPTQQQLIGIKTSRVERRTIERTIHAVGKIAYDPELYQAQTEYIQAMQSAKSQAGSEISSAPAEWRKGLIDGAEMKLALLGLNEEMMQSIAKSDTADKSLLYAEAGEDVWVYANIFEYEVPLVKVGDAMRIESLSMPGVMLDGKIRAIDRLVDPATRTIRVRGIAKNEKGLLKPDMFVNVTLQSHLGEVLAVPNEAVLSSGTKTIVFIDNGEGRFKPKEVVVGQKMDDFYEVKEGLSEDDKVVTSGNFFVDSESRLKAALSGMAS